jgi:protein-disulfide isomerase
VGADQPLEEEVEPVEGAPGPGRASLQILVAVVLALLAFAGGLFIRPLIFEEELTAVEEELKLLRGQIEQLSAELKGIKGELAKLREEVAEAEGQEGVVEISVDDDPALGSEDAPVVIVEFSDFQCPFCKRFHQQTLPLIISEYVEAGKVRFVFRDFPLTRIHPQAEPAAQAAECADEQGKFWEMHDLLFERQTEWSGNPQARAIFESYARELELDEPEFSACLEAGRYAEEIRKDLQDGVRYGVSGTPAFFINGVKLEGAWPFGKFIELIEAALAEAEEQS